MTATRLDAEVQVLIKRIERVRDSVLQKEFSDALDEASEVVVTAARANVNDAPEVVKRYNTAKLTSSKRAPKGSGNVVAQYHPGNLRQSIQVLKKFSSALRRVIGPKRFRGSPSGDFKGRRVDGYYAHMVHDGTEDIQANPFMETAARKTEPIVKPKLVATAKSVIEKAWSR